MAAIVSSITPNDIQANDDGTLTIAGSGFSSNAPNIAIGGWGCVTTFVSTNEVMVSWFGFTLSDGTYDVVYTDSDGGSSTLTGGFTIGPMAPVTTPVVNLGTNSNDGTGDSFRTAFNKLNNVLITTEASIKLIDQGDMTTVRTLTIVNGVVNVICWLMLFVVLQD